MTLYEVHSALARSLGDPFKETITSTIYDGVRYSKQARQGYLYRACCSIMNDVINALAPLPKEQSMEILTSVFPSMISSITVDDLSGDRMIQYNLYDSAYNPDNLQIAAIINAFTFYDNTSQAVPLPIVPAHKAQKIGSTGSRAQKNDPIAYITSSFNISGTNAFRIAINAGDTNFETQSLTVRFIRYPLNQVLTDGTLVFDFEQSYMNAVLNKATLYGMTDGGDLTPEQILPLLAK